MTAALDHGNKSGRSRISKAPPPPTQMHEDELDVLAVFRLIRRRIGFISILAALLVALLLPFILQIERTYTSQARLLIQPPLAVNLGVSGAEQGRFDPATEVERLRSYPIAERLIADFQLAGLEEFNPPPEGAGVLSQITQTVRQWISAAPPATEPVTDPESIVIQHFLEAVSVQRSGVSNVIEIAFTSRDPQLAAQIPNAMIQAYLDARDAQLRAQLGTTKDWLSGRIEDQRRRVALMEAEADAFRAANGQNNATSQAESAFQITSLTERQTAIQRERTDIETSLTAITAAATLSDKAALIGSDRLNELERELQVQRRELAKMLQTYGDKFGFVVNKREAIAGTEESMTAEVDRHIQSQTTRIAALRKEEASVQAGIAAARDALARMTVAESDFAAMKVRVDQEGAALTALEEQQRALRAEATMPVQQVEILSPATPSRWANGRSKTFYLIAGAVAAVVAAITLAILREMLDQSIRSQQQLRGIPGVVPVGLIPLLRRRVGRRLPDRIRDQRDGTFQDAIRGVSMQLERYGTAGPPSSILVTSAVPDEGKSIIALALAMHLAAMGSRVLLVDADLRHGSVHTNFRAREEPGLANFISGQMNLEDVILRDQKTGIDFIARGRQGSHVYPDLRKVAGILEYARANNMTVVFDSAPALATSETLRLAAMLDRTLMVVRWGKTPRKIAELAIEKLRACCQDDVMVAINQVNPRRQVLYGYKDSGVFSADLRKYHVG
ncbi:hypothetical protein RNZ50_10990 [Paracoccaceae bacterium Fryx2]|nr:hypothetical protein [Paracoccaceae bacterium Fryx2]